MTEMKELRIKKSITKSQNMCNLMLFSYLMFFSMITDSKPLQLVMPVSEIQGCQLTSVPHMNFLI